MLHALPIRDYAFGHMASTRITAKSIREKAEEFLSNGWDVTFDFEGSEATQSFIDELVGVLVLKYGPEILDRITFKSCSRDVKNVIAFVVDDRAEQYIKKHYH